MFVIKTDNPKFITQVVDTISMIIEETVINFTPSGINMVGIDAGRVCMVSLNIESEIFNSYTCDKDIAMGLSIVDMAKILKRCNANDTLTLKHDEDTNKLEFIMSKGDGNKTRKFTIGMRDISLPPIKPEALEKIKYTNHVIIPIGYLSEIIKDAEIYDETMSIHIDTDGLLMVAESGIGEIETIIDKDDPNLSAFKTENGGHGDFALKFLKAMEKMGNIPTVKNVALYLNDDTPLKAIGNLGTDNSLLQIFLAPRIEDNEDNY